MSLWVQFHQLGWNEVYLILWKQKLILRNNVVSQLISTQSRRNRMTIPRPFCLFCKYVFGSHSIKTIFRRIQKNLTSWCVFLLVWLKWYRMFALWAILRASSSLKRWVGVFSLIYSSSLLLFRMQLHHHFYLTSSSI